MTSKIDYVDNEQLDRNKDLNDFNEFLLHDVMFLCFLRDKLNDNERQLILLIRYGYKINEVANIMKCSHMSVRRYLGHIKTKYKEFFNIK